MMTRNPQFSVSLMCMDLLRVGEQLQELDAMSDAYHIDVIDGHFAKNIALGLDFVRSCRRATRLPLEVHLMTETPDDWIWDLAECGVDTITMHAETIDRRAFKLLREVRAAGCRTGVAVNPATPLSAIEYYANEIDHLTIMTVDVGYAGQPFVPQVVPKIERAREMRSEANWDYVIQVDGACNERTFGVMERAGADMYVLGSSGLFGLSDNLGVAWSEMAASFARATGVPV